MIPFVQNGGILTSLLIEIKARFAAQRGRRGRHGKDNFWNDSGDSGQVYSFY